MLALKIAPRYRKNMSNATATVPNPSPSTCWECCSEAKIWPWPKGIGRCPDHQAAADALAAKHRARCAASDAASETILEGYGVADSKGRELGGRANINALVGDDDATIVGYSVSIWPTRGGANFGACGKKGHSAANLEEARTLASVLLAKHRKQYTKGAKR